MPTLYAHRYIIVVSAARKAVADSLAKQADPDTTATGTFSVGLSATGTAPATHYWCGWSVTQAQRDRLAARFTDGVNGVRFFNAANKTPEEVLTITGLKRISANVGGK